MITLNNIRRIVSDLVNRVKTLEAAGGGLPTSSVLRAFQAANAAYTNDDSLNNTNLSVTVAASGVYEVRAVLHIAAGAGGWKIGLGGTATATNLILQINGHDALDSATYFNATLTTLAGTHSDGGIGDKFFLVSGTIEAGDGGTFIITAAQFSANAAATTFQRGSSLVLTKLN